jgi:hypothetical protein
MATLAKAAYHLNASENNVVGFNEQNTSADTIFFSDNMTGKIQLLTTNANELPSLATQYSYKHFVNLPFIKPWLDTNFPVNGLVGGIYTNENAAALVGKQGDTLYIAFRGTNDNSQNYSGLAASLDIAYPDVDHWAKNWIVLVIRHGIIIMRCLGFRKRH